VAYSWEAVMDYGHGSGFRAVLGTLAIILVCVTVGAVLFQMF
jgi:hypothetical protein